MAKSRGRGGASRSQAASLLAVEIATVVGSTRLERRAGKGDASDGDIATFVELLARYAAAK